MKTHYYLQCNWKLLVFIIALLYLSSNLISNVNAYNFNEYAGFIALIEPDTIPPDTTQAISVTAIYDFSDTAEVYFDGLDSVILLQEDTSIYSAQTDSTQTYLLGDAVESIQFEKPVDSLSYYFATDTVAYFIPQNDTTAYELIKPENIETNSNSSEMKLTVVAMNHTIEITPSSNAQEFDQSMYGLNISDMFAQKQEPEGTYGEDQWQILSDLSPNVIRIASGGSSMLMHLLHDPYTNANSQGYGYNLDEIVHYFDNTDGDPGEIDIVEPTWASATGPVLSWTENQKNTAITTWVADGWITDLKLAGNCFDYVQKYKNQLLLPPNTRYLDAFIRLVQQIENDETNGNKDRGLRVKVIVCLNIISETVDENKEIIRYLRDNDIYDLDVYGVEMGNECYDRFYQQCMGFNGAEPYYEYLTGNDSPAFSDIFRTEMLGSGHAFLQGFREDPEFAFSLKVGLTGYDRPDPIDNTYQLRKVDPDDEVTYSSWNYDLATNYYDEGFLVHGGEISVPAFDAVIIHPYYGKDNFQDEIVGHDGIPGLLRQKYPCILPGGGIWNFGTYDNRLKPAFQMMTLKFIDLFKTGYEESFYRWGEDLGFISENPYGGKELWITEWNFKDAGDYPNIGGDDTYRMTAFENTFLQGLFVFEFSLKNIKINYDNDFWSPFMPITAFHSFGGGGNTELLNFCQDEELVYYYNNTEDWMTNSKLCDAALFSAAASTDGLIRHYYTKHTPYFATELIGDIYKNKLQLLSSNFTMPLPLYGEYNNLKPTVFIDPNREYLYIYYSNAWGYNQNFAIDPSHLVDFFDGALGVEFGTPYINGLDADFPYSTAGRCSLYDYRFNLCYSNPGGPNACTDAMPAVPYPIDLTDIGEIEPLPDGCGSGVLSTNCITVPPYSFGYIQLPLHPFYERSSSMNENKCKLTVYPNPTADYFSVNLSNYNSDEKLSVLVRSLSGTLIKSVIVNNQGKIMINDIPSGCYLVTVSDICGNNSSELLIKN